VTGDLDWSRIGEELDRQGNAVIPGLLTAEQCRSVAALYPCDGLFRSRVDMARHGFGGGAYKYFAYPLPDPVADLRARLYGPLAEIGSRWNEAMGLAPRYPAAHEDFLAMCRDAGQTRPTPLILRYGAGDYNRLHQDLMASMSFLCRWRSCCRAPRRISPAVSWC